MQLSADMVGKITRSLADRHSDILSDYTHAYGEPGYSFREGATTPMIWFGNWWRAKRDPSDLDSPDRWPRLFQQLESQGVELEWEDEWTIDWEGDGLAYRTQPDCYSWQPAYHMDDNGDIWTIADLDHIIASLTTELPDGCTDTKAINMSTWTPEAMQALGWEKHNGEFNNGWHPGMDDDPKVIGPRYRAEHPDMMTCWVLDEQSQFYVGFQLWVKARPWPTWGTRAACKFCGQDIEWLDDWLDRGGNTFCKAANDAQAEYSIHAPYRPEDDETLEPQ